MFDDLHIGRAGDLAAKGKRRVYRFLEMVPAVLAWATLAAVVFLSFTVPVAMAVFIIVFDVYWLVKTIYLSLHLRSAYSRLRRNLKINWLEKLNQLQATSYKLQAIKSWQDIYHIVFLPLYNESYEVAASTIEALLRANYPKTRMVVALCWEERGGDATRQIVSDIEKEYARHFFKFLSVMHPASILGELAGKGANTAYGGRAVKDRIVDPLKIPYDHILVSNFDIDTIAQPEYFGILTYAFLTAPNPLHSSYQPIPLYVNNIWEAPSFARIVAFSATFWHSLNQERPERLATFSSHSMPWQALVDVGFWQKNMVSEDSRIFWQCFLRYNGNYRVTPLYYPVSMDANVAPTFWRTMKNIYKQQRRWGYGVENVPYFLFGFLKNRQIPRAKKWRLGFITVEGFHSWATNAIILFMLGWLPVIVGGPAFNQTVLSFNLPHITRLVMTFAMFGLISSAVLSIMLLPPRPLKFGKLKYVWMALEWILFPVSTIFLGALPGLEAQTRLMLGRYMGFWATPKNRSTE